MICCSFVVYAPTEDSDEEGPESEHKSWARDVASTPKQGDENLYLARHVIPISLVLRSQLSCQVITGEANQSARDWKERTHEN